MHSLGAKYLPGDENATARDHPEGLTIGNDVLSPHRQDRSDAK
jgi:hypothetical protein